MGRTSTKAWRAVTREVRRHVIDTAAPCALCGGARGPIDTRTRAQADREARAAGAWWLIGARRPLALHVDHVVPFTAGGSDTLANAQPAHAICNEEKGAAGVRRTTTKRKRAVIGSWVPNNGVGQPLPGRAVPGASTSTHTFVADDPQPPEQRPRGSTRPRPAG